MAYYQPQRSFYSALLTNRRNEILHWSGSLLIYPAFAVTVEALVSLLQQSRIAPVALSAYGLWVFLLLPQLTVDYQKRDWHIPFRRRGWVFVWAAVGLGALLAYDVNAGEGLLGAFWMAFGFMLLFFVARRVFLGFWHGASLKAVFRLALLLTLLSAGWSLRTDLHSWLTDWTGYALLCLVVLGLGTLQVSLRWLRYQDEVRSPLYEARRDWLHSKPMRRIASNLVTVLSIALFVALGTGHAAVGSALDWLWRHAIGTPVAVQLTPQPWALVLLTLALMMLAADPGMFFSGQMAHLRALLRAIRHDYLRRLISRNVAPVYPIPRELQRIAISWRRNQETIVLIALLVFSLGIVPTLLYVLGDYKDKLGSLAAIGAATGLTSVLLYIAILIVHFRPRHIITPFTASDPTNGQLSLIAGLITQDFANSLRYVTLLLNSRQVENLSLRNDPGLAVFVTSRQDSQAAEQLESLGSVEIGGVDLPLGRTLSKWFEQLAKTRVSGTVQWRQGNTVAVSLEFTERGGRTIGVDIAWIPESTVQDVDEKAIGEIARRLALKLLFSLGYATDIASNWESLMHFVEGLDASYNRHWLHAISAYRKAIEIEEAVRGSFGLGYYHLGSALLLQGHSKRGLEYLQRAEAAGPPLGENSYMIALALYQREHDTLHVERAVFEDIESHCHLALAMRPTFPEALHLMGVMHYQRGKLRERHPLQSPKEAGGPSKRADPPAERFRDDYTASCHYLVRAISQYDAALRSLPNDVVAAATVFDEKGRLTQNRMSATHRLGDALRSLRRFPEAEGYYDDVLAVYPGNIQSLIDTAKLYCMSANWQMADEFLRNQVLTRRQTAWHKSVSLYLGWSLVGGAAEELSWLSKLLNRMILISSAAPWPRHVRDAWLESNRRSTPRAYYPVLGAAMLELDFALHQFPGYSLSLKQYNWLDYFLKAIRLMTRERGKLEPPEEAYVARIMPDRSGPYVAQLCYWLAWRIDGYLAQDQDLTASLAFFPYQVLGDSESRPDSAFPDPSFAGIYRNLKRHRRDLQKLLLDEDLAQRTDKLADTMAWLELGYRAHSDWLIATSILEQSGRPPPHTTITFAERWMIDVYAELSVLTLRIMAESGAYHIGNAIATRGLNLLREWRDRWRNVAADFVFSNKVMCSQMAAFHGWHAYCLFQEARRAVLLGTDPIGARTPTEDEYAQVFGEVNSARLFVPGGEFADYVEALALRERGFYSDASSNLRAVIEEDAAFNPHRLTSAVDERAHRRLYDEDVIVRGTGVDSLDGELQQKTIEHIEQRLERQLKREDLQTRLYYQDRASGALQWEGLADSYELHLELADVFSQMYRDERRHFNLSAQHALDAAAAYPSEGIADETLEVLARYLNDGGSYAPAFSAVQELGFLRYQLSPLLSPSMRRFAPLVFACVMETNLERNQAALRHADQLLADIRFDTFIAEQGRQTAECRRIVSVRPGGYPSGRNLIGALNKYEESLRKLRRQRRNALPTDRAIEVVLDATYALFEPNTEREDAPRRSIDRSWNGVIRANVGALLADNATQYVYLLAELLNNRAFNCAELGIRLSAAVADAETAVTLLEMLGSYRPTFVGPRLTERLAQYYDTWAWAMFRNDDAGRRMNQVQGLLEDSALVHDPAAAVIYYHLARVYVGQVELIWQSLPPSAKTAAHLGPELSRRISIYLRKAMLNWRQAKRLSKGGELVGRLRVLRERIDEYRTRWQEMQAGHVSG